MPATPAWPPRSAPRLFVETALSAGQTLSLDGPQAHYLSRVMRVGEGDAIILCDDQTGEWAAEVTHAGKRDIGLRITQQLRGREQVPDLWLCAALLKKDRYDWVLEKATELGVRRLVPVLTRRCVADKLNQERAKHILVEAAEQCARTALPELGGVEKLDALLKNWPENRVLFFADEQGGEPAPAAFAVAMADSSFTGAAIIIGPEGGFDDAERAAIRSHPNARPISLGSRILRGETAAIAATALWMGIAGDWA